MKLNLRDLFWLILAIALAVAWVIDHRGQQAKYAKLQKELNAVELELLEARLDLFNRNSNDRRHMPVKSSAAQIDQTMAEFFTPKGPTADLGIPFRSADFTTDRPQNRGHLYDSKNPMTSP